MTTTSSAPVHHTARRAVCPEGLKDYILFTVCAILYILPFMRLYMRGTDEATLDYGAVRIVHGQVFARDFFEVIGPGTFYWLAAFFKLLGVSFFSARVCLFITSLGTALLMYFLTRRLCPRYSTLPIILLAGTYFGGLWPSLSHHVDSNFFALLAVACIVIWQDSRSSNWLVGAGVAVGLTTAFLQPKGILLFCGLLVWLWVLYMRRLVPLAPMGVLAGTYCSVIAIILLYFWSKGALRDLIYANVLWPMLHYGTVNSVGYAHGILSNYWDHWVVAKTSFKWIYLPAAILLTPLLFVAALPAILVGAGAKHSWELNKPEILLYVLAGGALWVSELHRKDMGHLVFGSLLFIILAVHFMEEHRGRIGVAFIQIVSICAVCLTGFNLLCVLLTARTVQTRVGAIQMFNDEPALDYLNSHTVPGEEIFAYPYCPKFYFLASTTNPTPFSLLTYNYNTTDEFEEVVRILEQHKVKYVVWDVGFSAVDQDVFPSSRPPDGRYIVEPYLESHYNVEQEFGGYRIMRRKAVGGSD
jgi:hypothetical protein